MRCLCTRILFLLFAGGMACVAHAQPEPQPLPHPEDAPIRFDHLTNEDGLSQRSVYGIVQDRRGFMWFGTQNGLNRYDGHTFTVYEYEPDNLSSLGSGNYIGSLYEDSQGMLWIGLLDGNNPIDRFDPAAGFFTHYRHDPDDSSTPSAGGTFDILEDRDGMLWFAGWGLNRFDRETGTFTRIFPDSRFPVYNAADGPENSSNKILSLHEDRLGMLWVGTENGLFRYDRAGGTFTAYRHDPDDPTSLSHNRVWAIHEDRGGTLWVGTEVGLNRFDREAGTFERFYPDPRYLTVSANASAGLINTISSMLEDRGGSFWMGTGGLNRGSGGLLRFDRRSGVFTPYRHVDGDPTSTHGWKFVTSLVCVIFPVLFRSNLLSNLC